MFLSEYAGPMFVYLWFYTRPWLAYGALDSSTPALSSTAHIAAAAWSVTFYFSSDSNSRNMINESIDIS